MFLDQPGGPIDQMQRDCFVNNWNGDQVFPRGDLDNVSMKCTIHNVLHMLYCGELSSATSIAVTTCDAQE